MKWLNESMNKSKKLKDTYSLHDIEIFIKDQLPEHIDMDFILKYIKMRVPYSLLRGVEVFVPVPDDGLPIMKRYKIFAKNR